jgi:hypothetical protein
MSRFPAPTDRPLRSVTGFAVAVMLGAAVTVLWVLPGGVGGWPVSALVAGLIVTTLLLAWALAPRGFALEAGALVVERPLWPIRIPAGSVRAVAHLPPGALDGALRLAGSGGLFGWYGRHHSATLGAFLLYARRSGPLVLVDTDRERYVLSPEPADRFAEAVRAWAGLGPDAPLRPPRPIGGRVKLGFAAVVALVVAAAVVAVLATLRAGGAPRP